MRAETLDAHRMLLRTEIPAELAAVPDFALASLLAVDAQIQAWNRYGGDVKVWLLQTRIIATIDEPVLAETLMIETDWAVMIPVATA